MHKISIISIAILFLLLSCNDEIEYNIPDVKFNLSIDITRPQYAGLLSEGQAVVLEKNHYGYEAGYAGIIIIRSSFAPNGFYAFDRCCTHHPNESHPENTLSINPDGSLGVCPYDSSTFVLINGSGAVISGPAKLPLRPYKTSVNGNQLNIYN